MASFLDLGFLAFFLPVFVFMFLFVVCFAFLEKTKIFGEQARKLNIAGALAVAAISIFSGDLIRLISIVTPWIVFVFLGLVLLFSLYLFFGESYERVWDIIGYTPVFLIIAGIIMIGIVTVFEQELSPYAGEEGVTVEETSYTAEGAPVVKEVKKNPTSEALKTITHPRLLAAIFMLIIGAASIHYLADKLEAKSFGKK